MSDNADLETPTESEGASEAAIGSGMLTVVGALMMMVSASGVAEVIGTNTDMTAYEGVGVATLSLGGLFLVWCAGYAYCDMKEVPE